MPQPPHSESTVTSANDVGTAKDRRKQPDRAERQDTLLLSDVPDASALMPEGADPSQDPPAGASTGPRQLASKPQFPSLDLTPLSQRYELLAEAGHGSMGNVYKARDRETGETVALKLLKPEIASDQTMMERFKKELLFARKITHKNVCRVYDFNRIGGIAYTSMEFVEGDSLRAVLNRFGGLPLRKGLDVALQMCSALQEAHAQGIVHRDLKPENVMVDAQGNVKIMDFGIARSMDAMTRLTGSMVGTPAYMAPEQVSGKQVDFRTDIYALGLILYEIFTGQPAFQAENAVAVALKQMREAPKAPHEIDSSIPFGIERAIMKCLQKDPANRFQSVSQIGDTLRAPAAAVSASAPPTAAVGASHASPPISPMIAATNRTTNGTPFALHPLYGASALSAAEPKRTSKSGWILLLILLAGGAYGALRWNQVVQAEHEYAPLTISAAKYYYGQAKSFIQGAPAQQHSQSVGETNPQSSDQVAAKNSFSPDASANVAQSPPIAPKTSRAAGGDSSAEPTVASKQEPPSPAPHEVHSVAAPSSSADAGEKQAETNAVGASASTRGAAVAGTPTPASVVHAKPKRAPEGGTSASSAVQRRSDGALGESTLSVPPVNDHSQRYLWIGRFETEDRAQVAAKKVQDLGLPVVVRSRRAGMSQFFLVLSGPFGPERLGSVMEWLKEQGFAGIRVLKNPLRDGRLVPGVEQDPED
ncbi:MAG: protein kinase domain-containing protein [Candidatus Acidiferrales bacterium]